MYYIRWNDGLCKSDWLESRSPAIWGSLKTAKSFVSEREARRFVRYEADWEDRLDFIFIHPGNLQYYYRMEE